MAAFSETFSYSTTTFEPCDQPSARLTTIANGEISILGAMESGGVRSIAEYDFLHDTWSTGVSISPDDPSSGSTAAAPSQVTLGITDTPTGQASAGNFIGVVVATDTSVPAGYVTMQAWQSSTGAQGSKVTVPESSYVQMSGDGTNLSISWSPDGHSWTLLSTFTSVAAWTAGAYWEVAFSENAPELFTFFQLNGNGYHQWFSVLGNSSANGTYVKSEAVPGVPAGFVGTLAAEDAHGLLVIPPSGTSPLLNFGASADVVLSVQDDTGTSSWVLNNQDDGGVTVTISSRAGVPATPVVVATASRPLVITSGRLTTPDTWAVDGALTGVVLWDIARQEHTVLCPTTGVVTIGLTSSTRLMGEDIRVAAGEPDPLSTDTVAQWTRLLAEYPERLFEESPALALLLYAASRMMRQNTLFLGSETLPNDPEYAPGWNILDPTNLAEGEPLGYVGQFVGNPNVSNVNDLLQQVSWRRGTPGGLLAAIANRLAPGANPSLVERINGDPYQAELVLLASDVVGGTAVTATTTGGSTTLTVNTSAGMAVGDPIAGPNLSTGTVITTVSASTTVIVSQPATGTGTATSVFAPTTAWGPLLQATAEYKPATVLVSVILTVGWLWSQAQGTWSSETITWSQAITTRP